MGRNLWNKEKRDTTHDRTQSYKRDESVQQSKKFIIQLITTQEYLMTSLITENFNQFFMSCSYCVIILVKENLCRKFFLHVTYVAGFSFPYSVLMRIRYKSYYREWLKKDIAQATRGAPEQKKW